MSKYISHSPSNAKEAKSSSPETGLSPSYERFFIWECKMSHEDFARDFWVRENASGKMRLFTLPNKNPSMWLDIQFFNGKFAISEIRIFRQLLVV